MEECGPCIWIDERRAPIALDVLAEGWRLLIGSDGMPGLPVEAFLCVVARRAGEDRVIKSIRGFRGLLAIGEPEQALEFVEAFTRPQTHYLLRDYGWLTVTRDEANPRDQGRGSEKRGYGVVAIKDWDRLRLHEPRVEPHSLGFSITRFVVGDRGSLWRLQERVGRAGQYLEERSHCAARNLDVHVPQYE